MVTIISDSPSDWSRIALGKVCIQRVVATTASGTERLGVLLPARISVLWSPASESSLHPPDVIHAMNEIRPSLFIFFCCVFLYYIESKQKKQKNKKPGRPGNEVRLDLQFHMKAFEFTMNNKVVLYRPCIFPMASPLTSLFLPKKNYRNKSQ